MSRAVPLPLPALVEYPDSDGEPMAENDAQRAAIMYGIGALRNWFAGRADVYVSGDLLIYYEEGDPRTSIAPDVFVVLGAEDRERRSYKLWEEPKAPDFVMEVASESTWEHDLEKKPDVYARLGVKEYWQYDPKWEFLPFQLGGWRLSGTGCVHQPAVRSLDGTLTLRSAVLGLDLRVKGREMHFHDPATGRALLGHREEHAARRVAEARAERESAARQAAETRAEAAETRAEAAETRIAALEALLRGKSG